uniref:Uncharacterized protein n=1 Tax=Cucumis melo TaxID=3656 RepID=A0A9I9E8S2_CUCME
RPNQTDSRHRDDHRNDRSVETDSLSYLKRRIERCIEVVFIGFLYRFHTLVRKELNSTSIGMSSGSRIL